MKEKKILLSLEDLYISSKEGLLINGFSLSINSNEIVAIVGESGSGKSLTALAIAGLLFQTRLSVSSKKMQLSGRELSNLSHKDWQTVRGKEFGMIFQEPQSSLNPSMRCGPQVMERLQKIKIGKPNWQPKAINRRRTNYCTGCDGTKRNSYPYQRSAKRF